MKKKKKQNFFTNYYNIVKLSRWVSCVRIIVITVFLFANLIFNVQIIHYNVYFTSCLAAYLIENAVFALASVTEEIFYKNKKRHILLASLPVDIWLITFFTFWPIIIILINISIDFLFKIIIAFIFAKLIANCAFSISEYFEQKIIESEEQVEK